MLFVTKFLSKAAYILSIPVITAELSSPEETFPEVAVTLSGPTTILVRRPGFSACTSEVLDALKGKKSVVLYGVQAHIAVQMTCLDLLERGFEVHIMVDGISSKKAVDRSEAIERMSGAGAMVETYESIACEIASTAAQERLQRIEALLAKAKPRDLMPSL